MRQDNAPEAGLEAMQAVAKSDVLADHYQKVLDLTGSLWEARGKSFIVLLAIAALEILVAFRSKGLTGLLADLYNKLLGPSTPKTADSISKDFPFQILEAVLLFALLYLAINLYHRTSYILRSYCYLARLEDDIRSELGLPDENSSFTREGIFYWSKRDFLSGITRFAYIGMVGLLISLITLGQINHAPWDTLRVTNVIAVAMIWLFFLGYAWTSMFHDTAKEMLSKKGFEAVVKDRQSARTIGTIVHERINEIRRISGSVLRSGSFWVAPIVMVIASLIGHFFIISRFSLSVKDALCILIEVFSFSVIYGILWAVSRVTRGAKVNAA